MNVKRILILCGSLVLCLSLVVVLLYAKQEEPPAAPTMQEGEETTPPPDPSTTPPVQQTPPPAPPIVWEEQIVSADQAIFGDLVLVDSAYQNPALTLRTVPMPAQNPAYTLQAQACEALERMMEDYTGYPLSVLYAKASVADGAAPICENGVFSSGLDICFFGDRDGQTLDFYRIGSGKNWLYRNAWKYGFVPCADTADDWRAGWFRYVGAPHAQLMQENNLTLADYHATLRSHHNRYDSAWEVQTATQSYRVFSVNLSSDGDYRFSIVQGESYTVSGDNRGTLIVTVTAPK